MQVCVCVCKCCFCMKILSSREAAILWYNSLLGAPHSTPSVYYRNIRDDDDDEKRYYIYARLFAFLEFAARYSSFSRATSGIAIICFTSFSILSVFYPEFFCYWDMRFFVKISGCSICQTIAKVTDSKNDKDTLKNVFRWSICCLENKLLSTKRLFVESREKLYTESS